MVRDSKGPTASIGNFSCQLAAQIPDGLSIVDRMTARD
jgi:hypothetical protein